MRTNGIHECIWYRILLPHYLPSIVEKVLFLDADTLVLGELRELFSIDMEKCAVAGCLDPLHFTADTYTRLGYDPELGYINAGALLINLDLWRKMCLTDEIIHYVRGHEVIIKYKDQDSINYVCRKNKKLLPLKYGMMDCFLSDNWPWPDIYSEELKECRLHPGIIHFAGNAPWAKEFCHRPFHDDWHRYNLMLSHPVRRRYINKGLPFLKMMVWKILH